MGRFFNYVSRLIVRTLVLFAGTMLLAASAFTADWIYVVSDGDNLWNLSEKYLGSATAWRKVQKVNQLPNPNWIRPGTPIRIPMAWISANNVPATVLALLGDVRVVHQDGTEEPLQSGSLLALGDRVSTGAAASASIEFADKSVVSLQSNSELSLDHLSAYGETGMVDSRLRLLKGRLETRVTPMSGPGSRFEIHTASAISAVRGTAYRMKVSEKSEHSSVEVTGGVVDVSDAAATENALINKGFGTVVAAGEVPLPPRSLLPAPVFTTLPDKLDLISWPISWNPVDGAEGYRVQLADGPRFETVRWQVASERPATRLPDLPDGSYYLRVRAIDELGLEGIDSTIALVQDAHPQPPVPMQPADGSVFLQHAPDLSWSISLEAVSYRVQVAEDPEFTRLISDQSGLQDPEYAIRNKTALGTRYWRTASIARDGKTGPFGAIRTFAVKATPATPETETVPSDSGTTVSWRGGSSGETYRVQIARDKDFKRLLVDKRLAEANLTIDSTTGRDRYLRVQAIDADGDHSAWGAVQQIPSLPDDSWKWGLGTYLLAVLIVL